MHKKIRYKFGTAAAPLPHSRGTVLRIPMFIFDKSFNLNVQIFQNFRLQAAVTFPGELTYGIKWPKYYLIVSNYNWDK